ncbi:uncharacterized protein [Diadema setosum]|uniref:uncharacterized protein n=1 Tax=Diadema setosum TaxID=31175 RepID=UPI003B3A869B
MTLLVICWMSTTRTGHQHCVPGLRDQPVVQVSTCTQTESEASDKPRATTAEDLPAGSSVQIRLELPRTQELGQPVDTSTPRRAPLRRGVLFSPINSKTLLNQVRPRWRRSPGIKSMSWPSRT